MAARSFHVTTGCADYWREASIGAATAKRLAEDGYDILLTYNTSSKPAEMIVKKYARRDGMLLQ